MPSDISQVPVPNQVLNKPAQCWTGIQNSADQVLFWNQDTSNVVYLGFKTTITVNGPTTIPVPPNGSFQLPASRNVFVIGASSGILPLVVIPDGGSMFRSLTQGLGSLAIPAIFSPNFVTGVSGWAIRANGSAEFNNVVVRGTIIASQFIGTGSGEEILIYAGVPAAGNLIASMTSTNAVDSFLNHILSGVATYSMSQAMEIIGGSIHYLTGSLAAGWSTVVDTFCDGTNYFIQVTGAGEVEIVTGGGATTVTGGPFTSTGGTAASPSVVTTDTWQQVAAGSFQNGWVGNANLDYRLATADVIEIYGRVTNAGGTAGGSIITTLGAPYQTLHRVEFTTLTDSNGVAHSLQLDALGHLQLNTAIAAGGTTDIAWRCPRSAPA